ncbi:cobalt ECF transporter T component CbiQ [Desulfothermobacter acidiphilus]|uniref:cobalt ECF transporter T component CbiQ n=1 Tax=Desulfothermobacter acidiphilus TaxID=1938353 RepID=UPI003F8B41FA
MTEFLPFDYWAYHNRWREVHPGAKLLFGVAALVGACLVHRPLAGLAVGGTAALLTVVGAGIPLRVYLRLLLLPVGFLSLGLVSLLLDFKEGRLVYTGLALAETVASRSLAAVAALYFLIFTTPVGEILALLRRLGVPALFLEICILTYRHLFGLLRTANRLRLAQLARGGRLRGRLAWRVAAGLVRQLFLLAQHRAHRNYLALMARGAEELAFRGRPQVLRWREFGFFGLWAGVELLLAWCLGR